MWNNKKSQNDLSKKVNKLMHLEEEIQKKKIENEKIKSELQEYQRQFNLAQSQLNFLLKIAKKIIKLPRTIAAYTLGRRNLKQLYSRSYKIKNASNKLKPYKYRLYNLGFIDKTIHELEGLFRETDDRYLRRAIAWELSLWYANKYTSDGARQALYYLQTITSTNKDLTQKRQIAILKAECYDLLDQQDQAKEVIHEMLALEKHPDLYLAASNLEEKIEKRLEWMNKVMSYYQIHPITFNLIKNKVTYDDLEMATIDKKIFDGPKVSIILPAYNFESGIDIAIESILGQTWSNIELLIVDDCSTDQTVQIVKSYMKNDQRIKLLSTSKNSGPYVARNIALQEATGEFITVNDADDWSHAEKIEIQVNHLIENNNIIANTSEHARLTEDLKFYRRGTPGKYIFSNMSSLMFRRKPVMEKIGFWDSVRFAADGEFKRRLIKVFGTENIVDLKTGPLSLPRQSINSLTGNSAFGYNGFFMGARKEYVESFEYYHAHANTLYYPFPQEKRLFPVPEPMWPHREDKLSGKRHFDVIIASDFRFNKEAQYITLEEIKVHKQFGINTGLIQISCYNVSGQKELLPDLRNIIDGQDVQMLVYGEKITCDVLIIKNPSTLQEKQKYIPHVKPKMVAVVIDQLPSTNARKKIYDFRDCSRRVREYFDNSGKWFAYNAETYDTLQDKYRHDLRYIQLSKENWCELRETHEELYKKRLHEWLVEDNPYISK